MSKKLIVISENCPENHPCPSVQICPVGALSQTDFKAPVVNDTLCTACAKCTRYCPGGALVLQ